MLMLDIRNDGTLVFQEMFSGALEYFYKGVSGCTYHCEGGFPTDSSVATSVAANVIVPVVDCEYMMFMSISCDMKSRASLFMNVMKTCHNGGLM